jgi:FkbM family methyltransferase
MLKNNLKINIMISTYYGQRERLLVYCGVNNGDGVYEECDDYDIIYGFDANPDKIKICQERFKSTLRKSFRFFNYALTDKGGEIVKFNIFENWDPSATLGTINPEFDHLKNEGGVLHNSPIKIIEAKTINLGNFLKELKIQRIDKLVTDLQGYDLTVLKTLKDFVDNKNIDIIKSEVEWDKTPPIYIDLPTNKYLDFEKFFDGRYEKKWHLPNSEDWWETDMIFIPKK